MDTNKAEPTVSPDAPKDSRKPVKKGKSGSRLTPAQKAEAVALWRNGTVTLQDLSKKFKKRPEAFSRIFSEMGIKKGEAAMHRQEQVEAELEAKMRASVAEQLERIRKVKDDHFKMADAIGKLVWSELVEAKKKGVSMEKLRGTMQTLQIASQTLSNVRGELYRILQIDKHEEKEKVEDLPELMVRELLPEEVHQLQTARGDKPDEMDIPEVADLPTDAASEPGA